MAKCRAASTKPGYVYVLWAERTAFFKIGFSAGRLSDRIRAAQTWSPYKIRAVVAAPWTIAHEKTLHDLFRQYRRNGEWFELPDHAAIVLLAVLGHEWARQELGWNP